MHQFVVKGQKRKTSDANESDSKWSIISERDSDGDVDNDDA